MWINRATLIAFASLVTCVHAGHAQAILGTGSAFAAPIYVKWAEEAKASTGVTLNYQASGSGVGQNQVASGLTDFGASDVPMEDSKLKQANLLQFPTVIGGVAVFVNLPTIPGGALRLTGPVLADIFLGSITRWNDPRIQSLNPTLELPSIAVAPLHHASASGTTFALSRYLAKVSAAWKDKMGVGMSLNWQGGNGVRGSYGAANTVRMLTGSIAYAESSYVSADTLTTIKLQNLAGQFVAPNAETFAAAAQNANWAEAPNYAVDLTDTPGAQSWPIVTATFVLLPKSPAKAATSQATLKFFAYALANGDDAARSLEFVPLPNKVKAEIQASWKQ